MGNFLKINEENWGDVYRKMTAYFPASEVLSRIITEPSGDTPNGKGPNEGKFVAIAAFYVDARSIHNRLNTTVGPHNWQLLTSLHTEGALATIAIKINDEWIAKSDVSEYTAISDTKGGSSKATVRAGAVWGIGAYFYDLPTIWHPVKKMGKKWVFDGDPKMPKEFLP